MKERIISPALIAVGVLAVMLPPAAFMLRILTNLNPELFALYFNREIICLFLYTSLLASVAGFASTLLGFFVAFSVELLGPGLSSRFKTLFLLPLALPTYLFTFSWLGFLGKRGTLAQFQMPNLPLNIHTPGFLIFIFVISSFPIAMLLCAIGIRNIPSELIEAGRIFSRKNLLKKIILPLLKPYLLASFFVTFFLFFSEYVTPSYLGIRLYQNEIFTQLGAFYNVQGAGILSLPVFSIAIAISSAMLYYFGKRDFCVISGEAKRFTGLRASPEREKIVLPPLLLLAFLCVGVPFFMLLAESELAFAKAASIAKNEILNALALSLLSSFLVTLFAFFTVLFVKNKFYLNLLVVSPFSLPSVLLAISLIHFYQFSFFYGSVLPLIHGFFLKFLPYSILVLVSFSEQVSKSVEEASEIFVRGLGRKISRIFLPLFSKGIAASFFIVFVLSMSEVSVTQLLAPAGFQTLAVKIDILMHYGNYSCVASLLLLLMLLVFIVYYLIEGVKWKR